MNGPVFLLGAGFNRDAKRYAGKIISPYCGEIGCAYPLVDDLARDCFGKNSLDETETIEELFATAILEGDPKPMECLSNKLMEADHYIAQRLLSSDTKPSNPYAAFFARFKDCHFLTFNYDSLPEIFLFHHKVWCPQDGYGIPVYGELDPLANEDIRAEIRCRQSSSNVLHLHGSLCIYSRSFDLTRQVGNSTLWVVLNKNPDYIFDPDSISDMFFPYKRTPRGPSYQRLEERVVAPVPDKAEGLQGEFIRAVHSRAKGILGSCQRVIVIGYRFNALDKDSYDSLLRALSRAPNPEAVLVCPDADSLKDRLSRAYPRVNWVPHAKTFSAWVEAGFPGAALT